MPVPESHQRCFHWKEVHWGLPLSFSHPLRNPGVHQAAMIKPFQAVQWYHSHNEVEVCQFIKPFSSLGIHSQPIYSIDLFNDWANLDLCWQPKKLHLDQVFNVHGEVIGHRGATFHGFQISILNDVKQGRHLQEFDNRPLNALLQNCIP